MTVRLLVGHVVDALAGEPAGHYHAAVTSPPYLWLRAYGTEHQVWGASPDCPHAWGAEVVVSQEMRKGVNLRLSAVSTRGGAVKVGAVPRRETRYAFCERCGAWRGELGQEPAPELYVAHLVEAFEAVRRVLRDDGSLWVNLAGCYYNDPGGQNGSRGTISAKAVVANADLGRQMRGTHPWLKRLDYVDVPGLFARAMQEAGWLWRSEVVWVKPSALPESVAGWRWERHLIWVASEASGGAEVVARRTRDGREAVRIGCPGCHRCDDPDPRYQGYVLRRGNGRPTRATERVLLFVKKPGAFFDTEAVRQPHSPFTTETPQRKRLLARREFSTEDEFAPRSTGTKGGVGERLLALSPAGRNLPDWWVLSPEPLKDLHYAAYPTALPDRCIRAGTSEWGCCPACGAPWARVVEGRTLERYELPADHEHYRPRRYTSHGEVDPTAGGGQRLQTSVTLGWRPTCRCEPERAPVPCRVLDPFGGSGSTALAANRLGREATLVELKEEYAALARKRVGREPLSLFAWQAEEDGA